MSASNMLSAPTRRARAAVAGVFFLNGFGVASWVVRIPAVQTRLGLSAGTLGIVLLGASIGALLAMPGAGRLVVRRGSQAATRLGVVAFALSFLAIPFASSAWMLMAALVLFGAANGALDVAMNAQAATVDREYLRHRGRPVMASFHALFSAGGLAGSTLGGALAGAGVPLVWHLLGVTLAVLVASPFATRLMIADEADGASDPHAPKPRARPTAALVPLGVLAFCVLFQEGAMADWTAVYLRDVAGTGPGFAAAGYAGFSITMATGRAVGDWLMARLGPARLVRFGGIAAAAGATLAVLAPAPATAVVGFACIGAGLASAFPAVLAASSRTPGVAPGAGIAFVSMLGYTGFLAGPPLIGFVAEAATLRAGIAVVAGAGVLVAFLAGALARVTTPRPASGSYESSAPAPAPSGR